MSANHYFEIDLSWSMEDLEKALCNQLEEVDFIGELPIDEKNFKRLCMILRGNGRQRIPPASFVSSMVFLARYTQEESRKFWQPYCHEVWKCSEGCRECADLFTRHSAKLARRFNLDFPTRPGYNDVVRPVYYQAIIPAYLQDDFAQWLAKKAKSFDRIAAMSFDDLREELTFDTSIPANQSRLRLFIQNADTREAATRLIQILAEAALLYAEEGQADDIAAMLVNPIERDLWEQLWPNLSVDRSNTRAKYQKFAKINWCWQLDKGELQLQVYGGDYAQRPVECQIVSDETVLDFRDANPYYTTDESWQLDPLYFYDIEDGDDVVVLSESTTLDRLAIPKIQQDSPFLIFRLAENETIAVLVDHEQSMFSDGRWLLCLRENMRVDSECSENIYPPEMLQNMGYVSGGIYDLTFPITLEDMKLKAYSANLGQPYIEGVATAKIEGLAPGVPPTFTYRQGIRLHLPRYDQRSVRAILEIRQGDRIVLRKQLRSLKHDRILHQNVTGAVVALGLLLPDHAGQYTINIIHNLKSILPEPLILNILPPSIMIKGVDTDHFYTQEDLPTVRIIGIPDEYIKVIDDHASVNNGSITLLDLRRDKINVTIDIDEQQTIRLAWKIKRMYAWIEGVKDTTFVTRDELGNIKLFVQGKPKQPFSLSVENLDSRMQYLNSKGYYEYPIIDTPLMDMLRVEHPESRLSVLLKIGTVNQQLFSFYRKPEIENLQIQYIEDDGEQAIWVRCQMEKVWRGNVRLVIRAIGGQQTVALETKAERLDDIFEECELLPGYYRLELFCDGQQLDLDTDDTLINVAAPHVQTDSEAVGASFIYEWLTSSINQVKHLNNPFIKTLLHIHDRSSWLQDYGLLPSWCISEYCLHFTSTNKHLRKQVSLLITPQQLFYGYSAGKGYAILNPYFEEHKPLKAYVAWNSHGRLQVMVPNEKPSVPFADLDEDVDLLPTYLCPTCSRFVASEYGTIDLTPSTMRIHCHRKVKATFYDVVTGDMQTCDIHGRRKTQKTAHPFKLIGNFSLSSQKAATHPQYHPGHYLDRQYARKTLSGQTLAATENYHPISVEHYKFAVKDYAKRYYENPAGFLSGVSIIKQAVLDANSAMSQKHHPAYSAYNYFIIGFEKDIGQSNDLLQLDWQILQLAMILRSVAHQVYTIDSLATYSTELVYALDAAITYCPKLLQWALTWTELFFVHAI